MRYPALALSALLFTGCASNGLVHDKNYVRAAAVSTGSSVELTLAFFSDEPGPLTVSGENLTDALEKAQLRTGHTIFTGFTELLVVDGNDTAETLRFMLDEWHLSPSCSVAYSDNAAMLLTGKPAESLHGAVEEAERLGKAPGCGIAEVLKKLLSSGSADIAALPDADYVMRIYEKRSPYGER